MRELPQNNEIQLTKRAANAGRVSQLISVFARSTSEVLMVRAMTALTVAAALTGATAHAADGRQAPRLVITEAESSFTITAAVSQLVLAVPKPGLVVDKTGSDPMYFKLNDEAHRVIVSGWYSPASGFRGIKEFWAAESANWKQRTGMPEPSDVAFEQIASWNSVFYDVNAPGMVSANVRAHWVEAGTWIDVHASKTSGQSTGLRDDLRALLKSLTVTVKGRM